MSVHELKAQEAGEEAVRAVYEDGDEGGCSCETCVVREVLEAAWPHLRRLALEEAEAELTRVVKAFGQHDDMARFAADLGQLAGGWKAGV